MLLLLALLLLGRPAGAGECGKGWPHPCDGKAHVTINPLKGLPELPKTYWTWPIGAPYLDNLTVSDGLVTDYIRITGGISPGDMSSPATVKTAVQLISRADAASKTGRKATIGLNLGCLPGTTRGDPTACNATCEAAGVATFTSQLQNWTATLAAVNKELGTAVKIGSVMFDCESWEWSNTSTDEFKTQMTRKNELTFNATRQLLPNALVILYAYGAVEWRPGTDPTNCAQANAAAAGSAAAAAGLPIPKGWCVRTAYTFDERYSPEVPFSISLYELPEPQLTRDMFTFTSALAEARGLKGGAVVPYISLGGGYRRNSTSFLHPESYSWFDSDYVRATGHPPYPPCLTVACVVCPGL